MKKLFVILALCLMVTNCVTTDNIISENKLKKNMSKSEFENVFFNSSIFEDPLVPGSGSKYYPESEVEIIWGINKNLYYVFENVLEPKTCGVLMCNVGNGNLSSWHNDFEKAKSAITTKLNKELGKAAIKE